MKRKIRTLNVEIPVYNGDNHTPIHKNVIVVYQNGAPSKINPILRVIDLSDKDKKDLKPQLSPDAVTIIAREVNREVLRSLVEGVSRNLAGVA